MPSVKRLSVADAQAVTAEIREVGESLWDLVVLAYQGRAWQVLGYKTWDAYITAEFGTLKIRIPKEERREIVAHLRDHGLSLNAISVATGYDKRTVTSDLVQVAPHLAPKRSRTRLSRCGANPLSRTITDLTKVGNRLHKLITADTPLPAEAAGWRHELEHTRHVLDEAIQLLDRMAPLK